MGIAAAIFDPGGVLVTEVVEAAGASMPGVMRGAETTKVEDVQGQQDFRSRLDSFTAPPPSQLIASPQPLEEGSLAVVATLLTSPEEMSATATAVPLPTVPPPRPVSGADAGAAFLIGVQEALQHNLAAERQRLATAVPQPDAGLSLPLAGNLTPSSPARSVPDLPAPDPRQTRAELPPKQTLSPTCQLPLTAGDTPLLGPVVEISVECLAPVLVDNVPAPAPVADPVSPSLASEEGGSPCRLNALVVAAVFAVGLSSAWWADSLLGQAGVRPALGRGRRGKPANDKR
jgi:hypothetical protein